MRRTCAVKSHSVIAVTFVISFLCASLRAPPAQAETISGAIFAGAYRALAGDTCASSGNPADADCSASLAAQRAAQLTETGQTEIYGALGDLRKERVECGIKKQESLMASPEARKASMDRINRALPKLAAVKNAAGALMAKMQVLRGQLPQVCLLDPNSTQAKGLIPCSPSYLSKVREYYDLNYRAKGLLEDYERQLNDVLQSESLKVRDFIEGRLGGLFSSIKPLQDKDFAELQGKVMENLKENRDDLKEGPGNYSNAVRNSLALDGDLVGILLNKKPELKTGIERLTCTANQRAAGKEALQSAGMAASLIFPAGAFAFAGAARIAFVAKAPRLVNSLTVVGKGFSYAAMVAGTAQAAAEVYQRCNPEVITGVKSKGDDCAVSAKEILEEEDQSSCRTSALWALSPVLGKIASSILSNTKRLQHEEALADFIKDHGGNRRLQELGKVDELLKKDTDRVRVTEEVLKGLGLRKVGFDQKQAKGLIDAHNVPMSKPPRFTPEEIEQKRKIMADAGISWREREIILHKGFAGRFEGRSDAERASNAARIKKHDDVWRPADSTEHAREGIIVELMRKAPDPAKILKGLKDTLDYHLDKYMRGDWMNPKEGLLTKILEDSALAATVSRLNEPMFNKAKLLYTEATRLQLKIGEKGGKDPKKALQELIDKKKAVAASGVEAERNAFEIEALTEMMKRMDDPKYMAGEIKNDAFNFSKMRATMDEAKDDIGTFANAKVDEARSVASASGAAAGNAAGNATAAASRPAPTSLLVKSAGSESDSVFAARQKTAESFAALSDGRALTNMQSQFMAYKLPNIPLDHPETVKEMRKIGFTDAEIRVLQLNGVNDGRALRFEPTAIGANASRDSAGAVKFQVLKPTSAMTEDAVAKYANPILTGAKEPAGVAEAKQLFGKALDVRKADKSGYRGQPFTSAELAGKSADDQIKDAFIAAMNEIKETNGRIQSSIMSAKDSTTIAQQVEYRRVSSAKCRAIYDLFQKTGLTIGDSTAAAFATMVKTGECKY